MDFEIIWTEPAVDDLETAVQTLAEEDAARAEDLRVELLESVEILARFPHIGPAYDRDRTGQTREITCRYYRIFYRVREPRRRVEILSVWHRSRREPRLPE